MNSSEQRVKVKGYKDENNQILMQLNYIWSTPPNVLHHTYSSLLSIHWKVTKDMNTPHTEYLIPQCCIKSAAPGIFLQVYATSHHKPWFPRGSNQLGSLGTFNFMILDIRWVLESNELDHGHVSLGRKERKDVLGWRKWYALYRIEPLDDSAVLFRMLRHSKHSKRERE